MPLLIELAQHGRNVIQVYIQKNGDASRGARRHESRPRLLDGPALSFPSAIETRYGVYRIVELHRGIYDKGLGMPRVLSRPSLGFHGLFSMAQ